MPSKLPIYTLRVQPDIIEKIKYIAEYNGRSTNKEIEQLLKQHIAAYEKENGTIDVKHS